MGKPHSGFGQGNRSLLASHGAGKGSADRTNNRAAFERNFDEIDFDREGFFRSDNTNGFNYNGRGKLVKKYVNTTKTWYGFNYKWPRQAD